MQDCSLEGSGRDSGDNLEVQAWIWNSILGPFWEPKGKENWIENPYDFCCDFWSLFGAKVCPKGGPKSARLVTKIASDFEAILGSVLDALSGL